MQEQLPRTFTYEEQPFYTLSVLLEPESNSLQILLKTQTPSFPKFFTKILTNQSLAAEQKFIFQSIEQIYTLLQQMQDVEVDEKVGEIKLFVNLTFNKSEQRRTIILKLQRCIKSELDEIRTRLTERGSRENSQEWYDLDNRIEKLWRREEENEKIYMKFKEETEFRLEEMSERMTIQNTKISIIRQDISEINENIKKLTMIVCPILSKVTISEQYLSSFILQDSKIVYVGDTGVWTQVLLKQKIKYNHEKYQFAFKIVNSKKNNLCIGVLNSTMFKKARSVLKKEQGFVALTANGTLFQNSQHSSHSDSSTERNDNQRSSDPMKVMQVITMIVDLSKGKVCWKCGGKTLADTRLGDLKNESLSVFLEFCDPGDAVEII